MINISIIEKDSSTKKRLVESNPNKKIVMPADFLTKDESIMKGYNTYTNGSSIFSSVFGYSEQIDKLICVNPIKSRYQPEIGDVIVGRILEVTYKRWIVDIGAKQNAVLLLSSVNLPGGELNLVKVRHNLCKKCKSQFNYFENGFIILASNGWVWVGPKSTQGVDLSFVAQPKPYQKSTVEDHLIVSRYGNIIELMSRHGIYLSDATLKIAFELSMSYEVKELILSEISTKLSNDIIEAIS
ncbi:hypothetical protein MXB_216 [Myxobolus squamalis]|nr:hypothetical protein MXB_216 [Myxobolus squamalis]